MALRVPLPAEIALARAAAGLSRLAGTGGGTTLPGKLLWKLDPGAVDRLADRLPQGRALVSATNGKTTTSPPAAGGRLSSGSTTHGTPHRSSSTRRTRSGASAAGRHTPTRRPTSGTSATTAARVAGTRGPLWRSRLARSS